MGDRYSIEDSTESMPIKNCFASICFFVGDYLRNRHAGLDPAIHVVKQEVDARPKAGMTSC